MAYEKMKSFVEKWRPRIEETMFDYLEEKRGVAKGYGDINDRALSISKAFIEAGGKRIRPILVLLGEKEERGEIDEDGLKLGTALELMHTLLLIHDDVMDKDEFRRNKPTVWKRFYDTIENGKDRFHVAISFAITTGDIIYAYVFDVLSRLDVERDTLREIVEMTARILELTGYGQNLDMYLELVPLSEAREEDILNMYYLKTAVYSVAGPLAVGSLLGNGRSREALWKYGENMGIAFQIHDDILGLYGDEKVLGKPVGSDVREGKRTILVVEAYRNASEEERKELERIIGKEDATKEEIEKVRKIVEKNGGLDYAKKLEDKYYKESLRVVEDLRDPEVRDILKEMAHYFIKREK